MTITDWTTFVTAPPLESPTVITVGVFDGVHRGHQRLILRITGKYGSNRIRGRMAKLEPVIVTFREHPRRLLHPDKKILEIISLEQKLAIFKKMGIARTILIDFSHDFSKMSGSEFVSALALHGNMRYMVLGYDFHCGYRGSTGAHAIQEINLKAGVKTDIIRPCVYGNAPVSSSRIREALAAGDTALAETLLGHDFLRKKLKRKLRSRFLWH
jgi:riboflavin kinase/FMN adenylyltransferase